MASLLRSHWPKIHKKEFKQSLRDSELLKFTRLEIEQLGSNSCSDSCKLIGQITYTLSLSFLSYKCFYLAMNKIMYIYVCVCVYIYIYIYASQVVLVVKNLPAQCRRCKRCGFNPWVGNMATYSSLEEGTATDSSILTWRIHGQRSLQSIGSQRVRHNWSNLAPPGAHYIPYSLILSFQSFIYMAPTDLL